jgi:hypothetical protein
MGVHSISISRPARCRTGRRPAMHSRSSRKIRSGRISAARSPARTGSAAASPATPARARCPQRRFASPTRTPASSSRAAPLRPHVSRSFRPRTTPPSSAFRARTSRHSVPPSSTSGSSPARTFSCGSLTKRPARRLPFTFVRARGRTSISTISASTIRVRDSPTRSFRLKRAHSRRWTCSPTRDCPG